MAELAALSLMLPSSGLGECIMTRLDDGSLRIDHADPRVLIAAEVLDTIAAAPSGDTWVDLVNGEGFLKIRGVNQHVVYRLADYVPESRCYIGEWPD